MIQQEGRSIAQAEWMWSAQVERRGHESVSYSDDWRFDLRSEQGEEEKFRFLLEQLA